MDGGWPPMRRPDLVFVGLSLYCSTLFPLRMFIRGYESEIVSFVLWFVFPGQRMRF